MSAGYLYGFIFFQSSGVAPVVAKYTDHRKDCTWLMRSSGHYGPPLPGILSQLANRGVGERGQARCSDRVLIEGSIFKRPTGMRVE